MDEKSLKNLEYNKIIERLRGCAVSKMAKALADELLPSSDLFDINQWQDETTDATSCLLRYGSMPLGGIADVAPSVKRATFGGVLSIAELLKMGDVLRVVQKVKNYSDFEDGQEPYKTLDPYFSSLMVLKELSAEIERCILSETELADDASPTLRSIRREIRVHNERIKETLNKIIRSQTYKNMLQDPVITTRSGRYCVPVKQEYKNAFDGMIHDQSSTGATFFIEPMSVVNLNNAVKECEAKEKKEIEKILDRLTQLVAENGDYILANLNSLTMLDFIFARGNLSLQMNATRPVFNNKRYIDLKKARHPLLEQSTVVPTDIRLGKDFTTLMITGPNTGGKTVALKTLGLFTLMGQAGLHIPAFDHSELGVFDSVYSDIGDEQSIEQNLSTFSAHMTNIVRILEKVSDQSLVLFDELGAGTDPTEGAALAMSIISSLKKREIRTALTTHYSELKVFAISTEGVENASCEFDVESLRPTYRLLIGVPGKSNAFAISKRLGMSDAIIEEAKSFISHENVRFEDVITELEISRKSVELEQKKAEDYRIEAQRYKKEIEDQKERMRLQKAKILEQAKKEAYEITLAASQQAEAIVKEMKKKASAAMSAGAVDAERKQLSERLADTYEAAHVKRQKGHRMDDVEEGQHVYILSFKQPGIVLAKPNKNGDVKVLMGNMKIDINIKDLESDDNVYQDKSPKVTYAKEIKVGKSLKVATEIDLRGQSSEEALENTTKYLDDAYLAGLKTVSIIHGKGTGVLRQAIHKMLAKNPHAKSYRLGTFGEGETGVTVVEIKE